MTHASEPQSFTSGKGWSRDRASALDIALPMPDHRADEQERRRPESARETRARMEIEYFEDPMRQSVPARRSPWRMRALSIASALAAVMFGRGMWNAVKEDQAFMNAARANEDHVGLFVHNQLIYATPARNDGTLASVSPIAAEARPAAATTDARAVGVNLLAHIEARISPPPKRADVVAPATAPAINPVLITAPMIRAPIREASGNAPSASGSRIVAAAPTRKPAPRNHATYQAIAAAHYVDSPQVARAARASMGALPAVASLAPGLAWRPETPARADVVRALANVSGAVRQCAGDRHEMAFVTIVFAASGRATIANVEVPYAGSPTGSCMARAASAASVPPFTRRTFSVRAPFTH